MNRTPSAPRRRAASAVLVLVLGAVSCAGGPSSGETPAAADGTAGAKPPAAPDDPERARKEQIEFSRTIVALDQRVNEFDRLGREPGDDARSRQSVVQSALEAVVAQNLDRLVAAASSKAEDSHRRIAAKSLAFTSDPGATAPLVAALRAKDASVQTNAAYALARRRDPETPVAPLLVAARAPDVDVRVNALQALWHVISARNAAKRPLQPAEVDEVLPVLETALFDQDDPAIRGHAAAAMGALGDARGVDPLLNLLRDANPLVRMHTALALGKLGDRRAIRPLVSVIDETPRGSPRSGVLLGLTLLLENEGVKVPGDLADYERSWDEFVTRILPAPR